MEIAVCRDLYELKNEIEKTLNYKKIDFITCKIEKDVVSINFDNQIAVYISDNGRAFVFSKKDPRNNPIDNTLQFLSFKLCYYFNTLRLVFYIPNIDDKQGKYIESFTSDLYIRDKRNDEFSLPYYEEITTKPKWNNKQRIKNIREEVKLKKLLLHGEIRLDSGVIVNRVPGGLIYKYIEYGKNKDTSSCVFVKYEDFYTP